jgi:sugar phosphate isomerase/epimerase
VEPGKNWLTDTTKRVREQLESHHLIPLDVEVIWLQADGRPDPVHHRIIEIGAELGARNCLIVSSEPDITNTKRLYQDLCERANAAGMRACLEFMPITAIRTLAQAVEVVEDVDHPAGGILIDAFHLERTGLTPTALEAVPAKWLPYVQLCDVPRRGKLTDHDKYLEDALDGRLAPGEGALPLEELMNHLPENIPVSLEVRSKYYRDTYPDPVERAKAILQRTRRT